MRNKTAGQHGRQKRRGMIFGGPQKMARKPRALPGLRRPTAFIRVHLRFNNFADSRFQRFLGPWSAKPLLHWASFSVFQNFSFSNFCQSLLTSAPTSSVVCLGD
jgi:hypothetical protein